jgi:4a-hydroxytetrahydrobiopterin dehydratase
MELRYVKLDDKEIASALAGVPKWSLENGKLARTFEFGAYADGALFAAACARIADHLNHHPDILLTYSKVNIEVSTHDVGGISPYDFELAKRIDRIAD